MKIKIWLCALAAMLLLAGPAMAEEMNLADIQVRPAPNAYGFPMTVRQCESLGLTVTGEMPEEGCFADVTAADANYEFAVRVDNVKGEMWVTGCTMKNNGAGMGHLQLNATTRAQALELLGAPDTEENGCSVYTAGYGNYVWTLRYDGEGDDALLIEVSAVSLVAENYHMPPVRAAETIECVPGQPLRALLDAGWQLPAALQDATVPAAHGMQAGQGMVLSNGADFVYVVVYNTGIEDAPLAECSVEQIITE